MKRFKTSRGFTLLEMLIALTILSVALLGLGQMMLLSIRGTSFGNKVTEATTFAQDKMEELRTVDWNGLEDGNDTISGSQGIQYQRAWTVVPTGIMKTINLAVSWNDGNDHLIRITSVITN
ncbi:MAG: prepilin-type N-terminal cleavage/methylation domain-containing protein [Syntrophobacterales bacterium]|nr:MAG: prepilin-type N-terminal cleavage/methylation domain-containing protein [Syntrophobacterales bacterium]